MAKKKPQLSFWQIWNMSFGFLGIQFGFALQNANTSRIFETLGASVEQIPILWIAAPLTGLIVQPIVGYFSDRTWHSKLGRRRPFFLVGAILASIALCFMPNSPVLWVAAGMLWIMDASINISMEPFRAFVGDNLPDEQRTSGFAMQSFFIGTGAVIASLLPWMMTNWLGISNTAAEGQIADSVKWSFYFGAIIFFLAVLWTVIKSKEYSPEELRSFSDDEHAFKPEELTAEEYTTDGQRQIRVGGIVILISTILTAVIFIYRESLQKELFILGFMLGLVGIFWTFSGLMKRKGQYDNGFVTIMSDMLQMPQTMRQLAWVQFFSWFALFAMWIYTTSGITSAKYEMKLSLNEVSNLIANVDASEYEDSEADSYAKAKKELVEYKESVKNGEDKVVASIGVTKFFLDEKIISEQLLANGILDQLKGKDQNKKEIAMAITNLEEVLESYADTTIKNKEKVRFSTIDLIVKEEDTLQTKPPESLLEGIPTEDILLIHSLKRVQKEYNQGADWVGVLFAVYNGFAALIAFFLPVFAKRTSRKITHLICLTLGGIGLISVYFFKDPNMLIISMIGVGIAWASILSMPYAMLSGALPADKMGYYMGVFNFFIVIPQIVAATILGAIVGSFFNGEAIYALFVGGAFMIVAGLLTLRVDDSTHQSTNLNSN